MLIVGLIFVSGCADPVSTGNSNYSGSSRPSGSGSGNSNSWEESRKNIELGLDISRYNQRHGPMFNKKNPW